MKYYWRISRIKDEDILLSPYLGEQANAAWTNGAEKIVVSKTQSINSSTIASIEQTTKPYEDNAQFRISAGKLEIQNEPVLTEDGSVVTNWYKKNVGQQAWEKNYGLLPDYYKLVDEENTLWACMLLPEETNSHRADDLVVCDDYEIGHLWRLYDGRHA